MIRYEYKVFYSQISEPSGREKLQEALDLLAAEGWRLMPLELHIGNTLIMEREVPPPYHPPEWTVGTRAALGEP